MRNAFGWSVISIVVLALIGAAAGYLAAPRYRQPADGGEGRLRERAVQYYRALQVKDYQQVARLYTPARQLAETAELRETAVREQQLFDRFLPETQEKFRENSKTIVAENLEVEVEGDWAVVNGAITVYPKPDAPEQGVEIPIGELVWVRTGGDWWVYKRKNSELLAYGNPPDFALRVLEKQSRSGLSPETIELPPPEEMLAEEEQSAGESGAKGATESAGTGSGDAEPPLADERDAISETQ